VLAAEVAVGEGALDDSSCCEEKIFRAGRTDELQACREAFGGRHWNYHGGQASEVDRAREP
jgi:hypothetical protein